MSLINDALIKAERDRAEAALAEAARLDPLTRERKRHEQRKRQSLGPIVANALVVGALFAAAILIAVVFRTPATSDPEPPFAASVERSEPVAISTDPVPASESAALAADDGDDGPSPFAPPAPDAPPRPASSPDYALAGMSTLGDRTLLSIIRQSDRRSVWVPVGRSVGEITAVSYDPERDEAVIRVSGRLLTVTMNAPAAEPAE